MEIREQTFHYSYGTLAFELIGLITLGLASFPLRPEDYLLLMLAAIDAAVLIHTTLSISRARLSGEGVTVSRFFRKRSLRWSEIGKASMSWLGLKLQKYDEDLSIRIDSRLQDYRTILKEIYKKRPDLFEIRGELEMSRDWLGSLWFPGLGLLVIALAVPAFYFRLSNWWLALLFVGLGIYGTLAWLLTPTRVALEGNKLHVVYLRREDTYTANEIESILLEDTHSTYGDPLSVRVKPKGRRSLKLSDLKPGTFLVYEKLRTWRDGVVWPSARAASRDDPPADAISLYNSTNLE